MIIKLENLTLETKKTDGEKTSVLQGRGINCNKCKKELNSNKVKLQGKEKFGPIHSPAKQFLGSFSLIFFQSSNGVRI